MLHPNMFNEVLIGALEHVFSSWEYLSEGSIHEPECDVPYCHDQFMLIFDIIFHDLPGSPPHFLVPNLPPKLSGKTPLKPWSPEASKKDLGATESSAKVTEAFGKGCVDVKSTSMGYKWMLVSMHV